MIIYHILILRRKGYFTYRWLNLNSTSALYFTVLFRERLCLRQSNDLRNKLQDRYLKLVYKDQNCEFVGWTIWIFNSSNESARVKDGNAWRSKWNFPTCITYYNFKKFQENCFRKKELVELEKFQENCLSKKVHFQLRFENSKIKGSFLWASVPSDFKPANPWKVFNQNQILENA